MSAKALASIARQVNALRDEEASEASWFVLPYEGDDDVDWTNFQVQIQGPDKYSVNPKGDSADRPSPYKGALFRIQIKIPDDYPQSAPAFHFATRVWHPNVDKDSGKPCVDLLRESWKPTMGLRDLLVFIRELLSAPNASDSVNSEAAREITESLESFEKHALEEVKKYASDE